MVAKDKQDFVDNWEDYSRDWLRLAYSTNDLELIEKVRQTHTSMIETIQEVAEELYKEKK